MKESCANINGGKNKGYVMKIKLLYAVLFLFIPNFLYGKQQKKMAVYVIYTSSHEQMFVESFLPSIQAFDDYEIVIDKFEQECPSGVYMKQGWVGTMRHKVDLIIRAIKENWGDIFIYADVDIQFFGITQQLLRELMIGKDLLVQKDNPGGEMCAGFFVCRGNERTLNLWQAIKSRLSPSVSDQPNLNRLVRFSNPYKVIWGYLPVEHFCGAGTFNGEVWKPGQSFKIPKTILMHHANYTKGIENKLLQLLYVRETVERRKSV